MYSMDDNDPQRYDDLLDHPYPFSHGRPRMPRADRAAQFAPFAALTGFGEAIQETARATERRVEPGEAEMVELAEKLRIIDARVHERPTLAITRFVPDARKEGGRYETVRGIVKRVVAEEGTLVMEDGVVIDLDDIAAIEGELFDGLAF